MDQFSRSRSQLPTNQIEQAFRAIRTYDYNGTRIRTVCKNDVIWIVFSDVCQALGYANSRAQFKKLPDEVRTKVDILAKNTFACGVDKTGLYRFCLLSPKPGARAFYAWAVEEQIFEDYDGR